MTELGDKVAEQLEVTETQDKEEFHKSDMDHLDDPHGLLTKPGLKGAIGKGKDSSKANS